MKNKIILLSFLSVIFLSCSKKDVQPENIFVGKFQVENRLLEINADLSVKINYVYFGTASSFGNSLSVIKQDSVIILENSDNRIYYKIIVGGEISGLGVLKRL